MKEELDRLASEGWVNAITNGPLTIYNYSVQTVFAGEWNQHTLAARGLVLDQQGNVIARPWPKFFNLSERPETQLDALPQETPELADKYDGSLIIAFWDPYLASGTWRAITRGCWDNVQTRHANEWLKRNGWMLDVRFTYLFELVAPWNRIVVQYDAADMVLIGMVETQRGIDWPYTAVAEHAADRVITPVRFQSKPLSEIDLADPAIKNAEGFVARFASGFRVKLKYHQYLLLHKIVTGLSVKGIWELLASGKEPDLENVPDEFHEWYRKQRTELEGRYREIERKAFEVFKATPKLPTRKDYAMAFVPNKELSPILFAMLDGKDYSDTIWKRVKPNGHVVFATADE